MITGAERMSGSSANPPALELRSTVGSDNSLSTVSSIASSGSASAASLIPKSANPYSQLVDLATDLMTRLADPTGVPMGSSLSNLSNLEPGGVRRQRPRQTQPSPAAPPRLEHVPSSTATPNDASTSTPLRDPSYRGEISSPQLRNPSAFSREHTPVVSTSTLASLRSSPSRGSTSTRTLVEPSDYCAIGDASRAQIAFTPPTSPNAKVPERAGCNDASSIGSSRSWVRDADSSSLCSRRSSCWSSTGYEAEGHEDGEVYKPGVDSDVPEFLDRRPEPPGAQIWIDRDDSRQVVVNVDLPGFSLENITVAFRRHHRLHVLADQYGENGGHYERTISLGPDVSSRSNRAAFDGTTLRIFIDRRAPRLRMATTTAMLAEGAAAAVPAAGSPTSSTSSSLPSPSLDTSPMSTVSFLRNEPTEVLIAMCSTGPLETKQRSRSLTGPEGAKAAARAARDEAMQRAKEAYQSMSVFKVGCKLPFRGEKNDYIQDRDVSPSDRSGTIQGRSHSMASTSSSADSISSQSTSATSSASNASSPCRPASMDRNLTLRARETQTFVQASMLADGAIGQPEASAPKFEKTPEECEPLRALSV